MCRASPSHPISHLSILVPVLIVCRKPSPMPGSPTPGANEMPRFMMLQQKRAAASDQRTSLPSGQPNTSTNSRRPGSLPTSPVGHVRVDATGASSWHPAPPLPPIESKASYVDLLGRESQIIRSSDTFQPSELLITRASQGIGPTQSPRPSESIESDHHGRQASHNIAISRFSFDERTRERAGPQSSSDRHTRDGFSPVYVGRTDMGWYGGCSDPTPRRRNTAADTSSPNAVAGERVARQSRGRICSVDGDTVFYAEAAEQSLAAPPKRRGSSLSPARLGWDHQPKSSDPARLSLDLQDPLVINRLRANSLVNDYANPRTMTMPRRSIRDSLGAIGPSGRRFTVSNTVDGIQGLSDISPRASFV